MITKVSATNSQGSVTLYIKNWRRPKFWRDIFLYFWIFSLVGHVVELIWGSIGLWFGLKSAPQFDSIPIFAVAAPYGIGAVVLLLLIYPLVERKKLGLLATYGLSVIITTAVEFISALLLKITIGSNPFWDYSDRFMNLFGFVCLANSLAFGVGALFMIYLMFPETEKLRQRISQRYLNIAFWILLPSYLAVQFVHWVLAW